MKILLIEDDLETAGFVLAGLRDRGLVADHAVDGDKGLSLAIGQAYDVIILDRMLPGLDGLSLVKAVRAAKVETPVLYLTTMSGIDDRVAGLEAGGDDYLVKPFAFVELLARIRALARRQTVNDAQTRLCVADLEIDLLKRTVTRGGNKIELLPQEFKLLEYLARHSGRVVTRTMLLENVWNIHFDPQTSVVESHISRLRAKIDRAFAPELIYTIRKAGYSLRAPD